MKALLLIALLALSGCSCCAPCYSPDMAFLTYEGHIEHPAGTDSATR